MDSTISLGFAVVGSVELIKRLFDRDYKSSAIIVGAALVGALFGSQIGVTWFAGLIMGLQGSGLVTTATYVSGK